MKKTAIVLLTAATSVMMACNNNKNNDAEDDSTMYEALSNEDMNDSEVVPGKYVNLSTNEEVYIIRDSTTGVAIDSITMIPVEFYYDPVSRDTLYQTGMRVNNMLIKEGEGKYKLDDTKIKIDGDEMKIKDDSSKLKIDGDEMKIKTPDGKTKIDDDGEVKVK